jgi:fumarate hydratase subunit beta
MNRIACMLLLSKEQAGVLTAGDRVSLSGVLYIARDAAHKRFANLLDRGEDLPFPLEGVCIY